MTLRASPSYRVADGGSYDAFVSELGVACGMAFSQDGTLYVGDRSGTVFRVGTSGRATAFATLRSSVAAFHLAWGPDDGLYVCGPTLATCDSVYRIDRTGAVTTVCSSFGRLQGLAFDRRGALHVVEALAGASGLYRIAADGTRTLALAARNLVGVAFDPAGGLGAASGDTAYRLDPGAVPIGKSGLRWRASALQRLAGPAFRTIPRSRNSRRSTRSVAFCGANS